MFRHLLICLMTLAIASGPMATKVFSQEHLLKNGNKQITSNPPKVMASEEVQLPKAKTSGGKYVLWSVLGVALVALAAGGGGGGGGGGSDDPPADTGSVDVGW